MMNFIVFKIQFAQNFNMVCEEMSVSYKKFEFKVIQIIFRLLQVFILVTKLIYYYTYFFKNILLLHVTIYKYLSKIRFNYDIWGWVASLQLAVCSRQLSLSSLVCSINIK